MTERQQTLVLCERCQLLYPIRDTAREGITDFICIECDKDNDNNTEEEEADSMETLQTGVPVPSARREVPLLR